MTTSLRLITSISHPTHLFRTQFDHPTRAHSYTDDRYRGQKLLIKGNGTFSQSIEPGATIFLQVKYGLITLIKQEADLCDNLPKIDITCPIEKGIFNLEKEVDIPKQVVSFYKTVVQSPR